MLLWQAGAGDAQHHPTPAVAMIDAQAPSACSGLKNWTGRSGVKSTSAGNRPVGVSSGSAWASSKVEGNPLASLRAGEGCCRKERTAKSVGLWLQAAGVHCHRDDKCTRCRQNGTGPRNPGNRMDNAPEGLIARRIISGSLGRMPRPNPTAKGHNGTWKQSRALEPNGSRRISAACAWQAGNRHSECPGQCPGYAKSGDATSKCTTPAIP